MKCSQRRKRKSLKQIGSFLLCFLCLAVFCCCIPAVKAQAAGSQIAIASVADLKELAQHCALDTWSQGKVVTLTADLDLTGSDFQPIPTFGGVFEGNGHQITGLELTENGSVQGLFRYIQQGGVVKDVTVSGNILPGGSKSALGGIAGNNAGSIQNCHFVGKVSGKNSVGGIAGVNEATGKIVACTAKGAITGERYSGGVAGENYGAIQKCDNESSVNIAVTEPSLGLEDLSIEQIDPIIREDNETNLSGHTDTGGIAGYSTGILQSCTNGGDVGYPHIGYNVGGIVGRQCGYVSGCTNTGEVFGRKDVGGIVGQMEPDIVLHFSQDHLQRLEGELDALQTLVNQALDHADASTGQISGHITAISGYTDAAVDSSHGLAEETADFIDGNIQSINDVSALITDTLDQAVPVLDTLAVAMDQLEVAVDQLGKALAALDPLEDSAADFVIELEDAMGHLEHSAGELRSGLTEIRRGLEALGNAVLRDEDGAAKEALRQLEQGFVSFGNGFQNAGNAVDTLQSLLASLDDLGALQQNRDAILAVVGDLGGALAQMGSAVRVTGRSFGDLAGSIDWEQARQGLEHLADGLDDMRAAAQQVEKSFEHLQDGLDAVEDMMDDTHRLVKRLQQATASLLETAGTATSAVEQLRDLVQDLAAEEPITFVDLGSGFRQQSDTLHAALTGLGDEMEALNSAVKSTSDTLTADLRLISDQFHVVMDTLIDVLSLDDTSDQDRLKDVSEEDINNAKLGKVCQSENSGQVEGDRNVGGIAGSMAIDYDLDPEDDIQTAGKTSLNFRYETRAILQECINRGSIQTKKDGAGGIAGRMDLGVLLDCQGYGRVESSDGDYVGGVVGISDSILRRNYAKCTLAGCNHIGGIAGKAKEATGCYAIVRLERADECAGAIAGSLVEQDARIKDNWFVDRGLAGIDGISYTGIAQPIAFETLAQQPGIPEEFLQFSLTFVADGQVLKTVPFAFGADLSALALPEIPVKEGYYSQWPDYDYSHLTFSDVLTASYTPWVTVLASQATSADGLALALAEGKFTQDAVLQVMEQTLEPPAAAQGQDAVIWQVTLTGTDLTSQAEAPLRLLKPDQGRAKVWQYENGLWQEVQAEDNGNYLLFSMEGTTGVFCIVSTQGARLLGFLFLGVMAVFALLGVGIRRKKKQSLQTAVLPKEE